MSRRRYRGLRNRGRRSSHIIVVEIDGGFIRSRDCFPIRTIKDVDLHGFDIDDREISSDDYSCQAFASMTKSAKWLAIRLARSALKAYRDYYGERYEVVSVQKIAIKLPSLLYYLTFTAAAKAKAKAKYDDDDDVVKTKTKTVQAIISHDTAGVPLGVDPFVNFIRIIPSST